MTRAKRITKLSHAIRDYRGKTDAATGKWVVSPQPSALARVERWLVALKLEVPTTIEKIDAFKTGDEFRAWLRTIHDAPRT